MNNNEINPNQKIVTKSHLFFIKFINIFLMATIGVMIYELTQKDVYFFSYILLGIVFILKGVSQYIYFKNNDTKKDIIIAAVFAVIGIALIVYTFIK